MALKLFYMNSLEVFNGVADDAAGKNRPTAFTLTKILPEDFPTGLHH